MKPAVKLDATLAQTSSIAVARPWAAKNCIRKPENQVKASSGVPPRYSVMLVLEVPCVDVLLLTAMPVSSVNASLTAIMPSFSACVSEW